MEEDRNLDVVEEALARLAVLEDVGTGDVTAPSVPNSLRGVGLVRARQEGVLSGLGAAIQVFRVVDPEISVTPRMEEGDWFSPGATILSAEGRVRSLLTAERSALNFLQHLSGVATLTARFVAAAGDGVRISDTRKTVPGMRLLEKQAVLHGGGANHRLGLYDAVMIKDNHIDAAGGIAAAVAAARSSSPGYPIVVEARSLEEAREAAIAGVGRILLDNMDSDRIAACVREIRSIEGQLPPVTDEEHDSRWIADSWRPGDSIVQIEVSGGVDLATAGRLALPGVDFLSVGQITHSAPAIDLAMDLEPGPA